MIKLVVTNEKNLELYELEKVHVGENKFGYYLIFLPEVLNDYNLSECEVKLIQIFEDNTSVAIDVDTTQERRPIKEFITLDATAQAQTVTLSVLITHNGDVIGKTNQKTFQVYQTKNATPIDPREDLDEIIAELRADKAELEETVSEQSAEITEKNTQITELSGEVADLNTEVTELTSDNTRLENLTDTQRETIQNMLDNPPQPRLETPDIIVPEAETRQYTPSTGYDGFASFTVKGNKYLNVDLQKFLARDIDFDLEIQADIIGNYLCYGQRGLINCRLTGSPIRTGAYAFQDCSSLQTINLPSSLTSIGEGAFSNCISLRTINLPSGVIRIEQKAFQGCSSLQTINLPSSLTSLGINAFYNCTSLTELTLPDSLTSIGNNAFYACTSLMELTLAQGFNCNRLEVSSSTRFTAETIVSCLEALADRTGQTAYTITFGTTNLNKLTAEQKAIATNKNWNLA